MTACDCPVLSSASPDSSAVGRSPMREQQGDASAVSSVCVVRVIFVYFYFDVFFLDGCDNNLLPVLLYIWFLNRLLISFCWLFNFCLF